MMNWGCFNGFGFMSGGWWTLFSFGRLLLLAVIIYAVVKFATRSKKRASNEDALLVLNARYARGEIDEAEYLSRKDTLNR